MSLFLLWQPEAVPGLADIQQTAEKFAALFAPLFRAPLQARVICQPPIALINLSLPVQGWRATEFEEDADGWALALDYPTNSAQVLSRRNLAFRPGRPLLALCRALEKEPEPLLRELAPPFALVWYSRAQAAVFVQTDGLGQTQLFEHDRNGLWALTNRITALRALDIQPAVDWR